MKEFFDFANPISPNNPNGWLEGPAHEEMACDGCGARGSDQYGVCAYKASSATQAAA
jgi:hypothetical protein